MKLTLLLWSDTDAETPSVAFKTTRTRALPLGFIYKERSAKVKDPTFTLLTRTEQPKVGLIVRNHVPQKLGNIDQRARLRHSRLNLDRIIRKLGHPQRLANRASVRDLVGGHSFISIGRERSKFRDEFPVGIKQLFRLVRFHPVLEQAQVLLVLRDVGQGHLMRSPEAFEVVSVYVSRSGPSFRGTQDDHRPPGTEGFTRVPGLLLVCSDLGHALFEGGRHGLVHTVEVGAFDKVRGPAVPDEEGL